MKLLIIGGEGQLGCALSNHPRAASLQLISRSRAEFNLTDSVSIEKNIVAYAPDMIINAGAYTAVDKAETEIDAAMQINYHAVSALARLCQTHHIPLLHVSTDYVFNGETSTPYTEMDTPDPINVYGKSKWLGEEAIREHCEQHIILRVSGVFSEYRHNFLKTILRLANERQALSIVSDQWTCPTYAPDIAATLLTMAQKATHWGTYHYCSDQPVSWYAFASTIVAEARKYATLTVENIHPIPTEAYPTPAKRPPYSVMDCTKLITEYGISPSSWQEGIKQTLKKVITL